MNTQKLLKELYFKTSRSSGKGGQNVNKVATKVALHFDVLASEVLTEEAKELILERLKNRISNEGILRLVNQETRSQLKNKERSIKQFEQLIHKATQKPTLRKVTKTPKSVKRKRARNKQYQSDKKANRQKVKISNFDLFLCPISNL